MADETSRPSFKKSKQEPTAESPEQLFYKLPRASTHGYLRGEQQDVVRLYESYKDERDVACELPTGTGKTAVGLLIADWRRRHHRGRAAYLTLTNQLGGQVLREAHNLGIPTADLRGRKEERDPAEEGKYRDGSAIAVTSYSNLFNVNPVIRAGCCLVFDDAHGGEEFVSSLWTVRLKRTQLPELYGEVLTAIRPSIPDTTYRRITDPDGYSMVEYCDLSSDPQSVVRLTQLFDDCEHSDVRYSWPNIRANLAASIFLISAGEVCIRAIVPPTHTHEQFEKTSQRIYLSATLGGADELRRGYGIQKVSMLRAKQGHWGRRYVFTPGLYAGDETACKVVADVWDRLQPENRRALLIAPSYQHMGVYANQLADVMTTKPTMLSAADIEQTMDAFSQASDVLLALAGRYDGVDLPDETCRVLILAESPAATNELERHQRDQWRMGPLLRRRERTRLLQGMGRCTRNNTDYSAILALGASLTDALTNLELTREFPIQLQRELAWGREQAKSFAKDPASLVTMIVEILEDSDYRGDANTSMDQQDILTEEFVHQQSSDCSTEEVQFARDMWDGDFGKAYTGARQTADTITAEEMAGYRAWWWFLASLAAHEMKDRDGERDSLVRGRACGINSSLFNILLSSRKAEWTDAQIKLEPLKNAQDVWAELTAWGWSGSGFKEHSKNMLHELGQKEHKQFHVGLTRLAKYFGAEGLNVNEEGAPDVVWIFPGEIYIVYEAKSNKQETSRLSKNEVIKAAAHGNWVKAHLCPNVHNPSIRIVVVSPTRELHEAAIPHAGGLMYLSVEEMFTIAQDVRDSLRELRTSFAGKDFAAVRPQFEAELEVRGITIESVVKRIANVPLLG